MQPGARLKKRGIAVKDQVIVAVAAALGVLRGVDLIKPRVDPHQFKIADKAFHHCRHRRRARGGNRNFDLENLALGIAPLAVIAHGPAGLVQKLHSGAQVAPVIQPRPV